MRTIITIAREYGAGGRTVGLQVAEELGIPLYDRDLVLKTAEESGILTPEEVRVWDEKVPRDVGLAQSLFSFYSRPLSEKLWDAQRDAIRKLADRESCVIVGRNADYILREFDHVLKVFIYADFDWRVSHMVEMMPEMTRAQIEEQTIAIDKARHNYCTKYTGQPYGKAENFDLTINTGKLGLDKAVDLILSATEVI